MAKWGEEIEEYYRFEIDLKRIKDLIGNLIRISKVIRLSANRIFWAISSSSSPICKWVLHLSFHSSPINAIDVDLQSCHASINFAHPFVTRPLKHFLSPWSSSPTCLPSCLFQQSNQQYYTQGRIQSDSWDLLSTGRKYVGWE